MESFPMFNPKPLSYVRVQNLYHINSFLHLKKSINLLSSKPISHLKQNPIRNRIESIDRDTGFKKRVSDILLLQSISKSLAAQELCTRILQRFIQSKRLDEARVWYFKMKEEGLEPGILLETVLIDQLVKSGHVSCAFQVFDKMPKRNVVTWTSIISGCFWNNLHKIGLDLFVYMLESGILPNDFTFNVVLQSCADMLTLHIGKQVHSLVIKAGLYEDCRIANCLIDFYSKCGLIDSAHQVFIRMLMPDLVSFTSMIAGFFKNNLVESAVRLFDQMRGLGLDPNEHTITSILVACRFLLGEQIHAYMIKTFQDRSLYSTSVLIEFYSRNDSFNSAELVFEKSQNRNVVMWSSMISCCIQNKQVKKALKLFYEMANSGIEPNQYTFATVIGACGLCSESIGVGRQLHSLIIKRNLESDDRIFNALLTMYARTGKIEELAKVFERIQEPDTVSWCAAIAGYSQNGFNEKSVSMLCQMQKKGAKPNGYGFSSALSSCASLALLEQGRQFHGFALKLGCDFDVCVGNALVNLYAKCGNINDAWLAFDGMPVHDVMSWNTLIHGYAHHGHGRKALQIFDEMVQCRSIVPNHATFIGVLSACSHAGYVEEALGYFKIMEGHYGVAPSMSHYACVIDMMGRAGRLEEAAEITNQMPFEPDSFIWKTLLGSCKVHKNLELGKLAAEKAIELSPNDSANYVLLSNLFSICGEWENSERIRKVMEERGVKKDAGWSWIEIRSEVHAFVARDRSHPRTQAIYDKLEELVKEMKEEGYDLDLSFALYDS